MALIQNNYHLNRLEWKHVGEIVFYFHPKTENWMVQKVTYQEDIYKTRIIKIKQQNSKQLWEI